MASNTPVQRSTLRFFGFAVVAGVIGLTVLLTAGVSAQTPTTQFHGSKPYRGSCSRRVGRFVRSGTG